MERRDLLKVGAAAVLFGTLPSMPTEISDIKAVVGAKSGFISVATLKNQHVEFYGNIQTINECLVKTLQSCEHPELIERIDLAYQDGEDYKYSNDVSWRLEDGVWNLYANNELQKSERSDLYPLSTAQNLKNAANLI